MGGGHGQGALKVDPAIERWDHMREDVYRHFRFTPRATMIVLGGVVLIPGVIYYATRESYLKWDWTGKMKGESLRAIPPSSRGVE